MPPRLHVLDGVEDDAVEALRRRVDEWHVSRGEGAAGTPSVPVTWPEREVTAYVPGRGDTEPGTTV